MPQAPVVTDSSGELLAAWESAGVRNAVLVEVSGRLGFQTVPFGVEVAVPNAYPFPRWEYRDEIVDRAKSDNVLWVGAQRGLFRTIHYVFTAEDMTRLVSEGRAAGLRGISPDGSRITPNNNGYLRHVSSEFPRLGEPVVLDVQASYFETGDPKELAGRLKASRLDWRVLTACRAKDDTGTSDSARRRLDEFMRLMGAPR